jgi:hypothetical protein
MPLSLSKKPAGKVTLRGVPRMPVRVGGIEEESGGSRKFHTQMHRFLSVYSS